MIGSIHEQLRKHQDLRDQVEAEAQKSQRKEARSFQSIHQSFSPEFSEGNEEAPVAIDATGDGVADGLDTDGDGEIDLWFPEPQDTIDINSQALTDHGQHDQAGIGAKDLAPLESALGRAQNYWYYENDPFKAAAALGHGIAQNQTIFDDGHKRTAFHQTRDFLDENGYGHVSPVPEDAEHAGNMADDSEYADHLLGYAVQNAVESGETGPWYHMDENDNPVLDENGVPKEIEPKSLEDTADMFRNRHEEWLKANGHA